MKKINGCRMYSNEEIKQMAIVGFSNEFIKYLKNSSENIRQTVEKMLPTQQSQNDLREACQKSDVDTKNTELCKQLDLKDEINCKSKFSEDIKYTQCKEENKIYNYENYTNPYKHIDFSKRIVIEQLTVTLTDADRCNIHNCNFESVHVVLLYSGTKRYGCNLKCCLECKRFFISDNTFKELETCLLERKINYSLTYDGGIC